MISENDLSPAFDDSSAAEKQKKYSGVVEWKYLQPHFDSGSIIYIDPSYSLEEAGIAFSDDNTQEISDQIKQGNVVKPCQAHVDYWKSEKVRFKAVIIRPFVLIQPVKD